MLISTHIKAFASDTLAVSLFMIYTLHEHCYTNNALEDVQHVANLS